MRAMTTVVADTGDIDRFAASSREFHDQSNPDFKAAQKPAYAHLVDEAVAWGRGRRAGRAVTDRSRSISAPSWPASCPAASRPRSTPTLLRHRGTIDKARAMIAAYAARGVGRERILIKIAATWEGAQAAAVLQREGIDCNLTLMFSLAQAIACADAGAFLISPFVGRILDWHVKAGGGPYTAETDPGVVSVRDIYAYYKAYGVSTVVMGASFRNAGEIEALAGCDRLTISPQLLDELAKDGGRCRAVSPEAPGPAPARVAMDENDSAGCSTRTRWRPKSSARASASSPTTWRPCAKWSGSGWRGGVGIPYPIHPYPPRTQPPPLPDVGVFRGCAGNAGENDHERAGDAAVRGDEAVPSRPASQGLRRSTSMA